MPVFEREVLKSPLRSTSAMLVRLGLTFVVLAAGGACLRGQLTQPFVVSNAAGMPAQTANSYAGVAGGRRHRCCSDDGRFIVYQSGSTNVVTGVTDSNAVSDIFLYDRQTQTTTLVSHAAGSSSTTANNFSDLALVSADGSYVIFRSYATNLVTGQSDANGGGDIFLFATATGASTLVSHAAGSLLTAADSTSDEPLISADGRYIYFLSFGTNLIAGQSSSIMQAFVFDRVTQTTVLASHIAGNPLMGCNGNAYPQNISADGRYVTFQSNCTDAVTGGVTGSQNVVFLHDLQTDTTVLVSHIASSAGVKCAGGGGSELSGDGRYCAWNTAATDVVTGQVDSNGVSDLFVYDRVTGTNALVTHLPSASLTTGNGPGNYGLVARFSSDGHYLAYTCTFTNLITGQSGSSPVNAFLWDRLTNSNVLVSSALASTTTVAGGGSEMLDISNDGEVVVFYSKGTNVVAGLTDANGGEDIFIWYRSSGIKELASRRNAAPTTAGNGISANAVISSNGGVIFYTSLASDIFSGDTNGQQDLFGIVSAPAAEMDVRRGAASIGDGGFDAVGSFIAGTVQNLSYDVFNTGSVTLNLTGSPDRVVVTPVANVSALSVTLQPAATVAPAASSPLTLSFTVTAAGAFSFTVSIDNDDSNENPYNWTVTGTGTSPSPEIEILRGLTPVADGQNPDGLGTVASGVAMTVTYTINNTGAGALNLTGTPSVAATPGANVSSVFVSIAPTTPVASMGSTSFTLTFTVTAAGTFDFGVSIANDDASENPYNWTVGGTGAASAPEIEITRGALPIADGGSDAVGTQVPAVATSLTYTVTNQGNAQLNLNGMPVVAVSNFVNCTVSIVAAPPASVAVSGTAMFTIEVTPTSAGTFSVTLSIASDDPNENPYDWSISGTAVAGGSNNSGDEDDKGCSTRDDARPLCLPALLISLAVMTRLRRRFLRSQASGSAQGA